MLFSSHTKLKHSNDREKMCNICGKQFSKVKNCKIHKYKKHKVDDPTLKVDAMVIDVRVCVCVHVCMGGWYIIIGRSGRHSECV